MIPKRSAATPRSSTPLTADVRAARQKQWRADSHSMQQQARYTSKHHRKHIEVTVVAETGSKVGLKVAVVLEVRLCPSRYLV
ncbi:hypothetical protein CAOG_010149 [Capsaspora owczarzaki ATCC 30864]|uniref:Uncharacterized protein n=1 Tax=Capsaspora owczarzaki (strain ATCC 30864) TaxID=595528 RepID=A0A0D2W0D9_CAPO3|nr:hypothetical protein CAOG_010149 [Capsaspora owczarzaki ATCC 30864]